MSFTTNPRIYQLVQSPGILLDLDLIRAAPYQYEPLTDPARQIRLLELIPGTTAEAIKCRLTNADRDAVAGTYEPLSYCWGDQSKPIPIYINDDKSMSIGTNLHAALVRLRQPDKSRMLWVDALCINQADVLEKNVQVQLMRSVYENGTQTVVWIGEEDDPYLTTAAFRIWEFANEYADAHPGERFNLLEWKKFQRLERNEPEYRYFGLEYLWSSAAERFAMDAIFSLLGRDWFSRVWIVQEIAVSKHALLICGRHTISWDRLQRANEVSYMPSGSDQVLVQLMDQRNKYLRSVSEDLSAKIWNVAAPAQATDPRDRVYALLGLMVSPRVVDVPVTVDYNLAAQDLFRDLTRRHLEIGKDVGFLACSVGCRDQGGVDSSLKSPVTKPRNNDGKKDGTLPMPSWVWRPIETLRDLNVEDLFAWDVNGANFGRFQASGSALGDGPDDSIVFDDSLEGSHFLGLSGYEFDQISDTGPAIDPPGRGMQFDFLWASVAYGYIRWRQMAVECRGTLAKGADKTQRREREEQKYVGTDEPRLEAFRKTIQPVPTGSKGVLADEELAAIFNRFDAFMLRYFDFLENEENDSSPATILEPSGSGTASTQVRWWAKRPVSEQQQQQQQRQSYNPSQKIGNVDLARYSLQLQRLAWMHKFNSGDTRVVDSAFRVFRATNRRFCMTTKGYMVLAPREATIGDCVVLLKGARAPFILRGVDTVSTHTRTACAGNAGRELWKIVGDCRVHGIMHGEAWDESRCRRIWIG